MKRKAAGKLPTQALMQLVESLGGQPIPAKQFMSVVVRDGVATVVEQSRVVAGIELPPDQEEAFGVCVRKRMEKQTFPASELSNENVELLRQEIQAAMRQGFYLAVMRYADELKHVPEAAAMLESLRRNSAKGAAARRKQAAPTHRAIQKRFRELRKTTPKKTARYLRIAGEFKMSDRQIARIVDGID